MSRPATILNLSTQAIDARKSETQLKGSALDVGRRVRPPLMVCDDSIMGTPPPHPNLSNTRLGLLHQTPGSIHGAQESIGVDLTPVAGPSSATLSDTPVARLRALLAHPSSSLSRRYPLTRPGRNNSGMNEMHVAPVLDHAREQYKGKLKSLGDDEPSMSIPFTTP
jgi:hypothetical protein